MYTKLMAVLIALVLVFGGAAATASAAQESLPTDALYSVKTLGESVALGLSVSPAEKLEKALDHTQWRVKEMAALTKMGVTIPENVKTEMRLRALEGGATSKTDVPVSTSINDTIAEAKEILGVANIGTDDPEIVALWKSKQYPDTIKGHAELLRDVTKIAVARAKSPSPTSAQAAAQPGRVMPSPTQEGLLNEYTKDMLANRGNRTAILAVKEKYRKMGLDVDRVAFK